MRKVGLVVAFLGCLVLATAVSAQEDEVVDVLEVSLIGGLGFPAGGITEWNDDLNADNGFNIGMDIGYFINPSWVVGVNFTYHAFGVDHPEAGDLHHKVYSPRLYGKYIRTTESSFEPYVKAHIGLDNPKFATDVSNAAGDRYREISYDPALSFGLTAGLFYFTSDYSGLFAEMQYHRALAKDVEAEYEKISYMFEENYSSFDINVGIRVLVGSGD
ncbi:MAG: outer membrane beta-barrel protein [bacterium]|nr:outer membrane beta-barrel protein [bacterium]